MVAAGVPGAGGYDALFVVLLEPVTAAQDGGVDGGAAAPSPVRDAVDAVWLRWPGGGLTPLLLRDGPAAGCPGAGVLRHAAPPT